jgi:hypothetical protein
MFCTVIFELFQLMPRVNQGFESSYQIEIVPKCPIKPGKISKMGLADVPPVFSRKEKE